ncbi:MAG TPA: tRNA (adenosine(37)-N6)-dimethylallyltransferase MiaA [Cytophagales bacterium]|nr:tRNA (adenosine(37)-N6)-dimethylallyltransferase MiaA [Cytophagales bacterium]
MERVNFASKDFLVSQKPTLIVVVGPTAVGKTTISIELAKEFQCEILSADSRQFYREMSIGTAKPNPEQLQMAKHHFVNNLSIHESYSVGDFEQDVLNFLNIHFENKPIALLVGGSGLYIDAVLKGLDDIPQVPEALRWQIMEEAQVKGLSSLVKELQVKDPVYFNLVDKENTQRVVRALEVIRHTDEPFSSFLKKTRHNRNFNVLKIGLNTERSILYQTIDQRVDSMMQEGLLEEAKALYPYKNVYALQTVGYKELFDHFEGKHSLETAIELIKRNTRRFAKRQLTWFRRDAEISWFENNEIENIKEYLATRI